MRIRRLVPALTVALALAATACGGSADEPATTEDLSGSISIDGSSTVFPVSEAIAEEFQKDNSKVQVTVGQSGTGGGFKKFCNDETDITDASRPIKPDEAAACTAKGIEYIELKVAIDGLSVVVNPQNSFVTCLTTAQLKKTWEPNSKVKTWRDIDAKFPAEALKLYGPGADSGTFDYFTEAVVGTAKSSRSDYQASEDDNVLVQGVSGDKNALGYFGYAYVVENTGKVKPLSIDGGTGCVAPSKQTIEAGTYKPLSRPLFIYVKRKSLARPDVRAFTQFYVDQVNAILPDVGYIQLPAGDMTATKTTLAEALK